VFGEAEDYQVAFSAVGLAGVLALAGTPNTDRIRHDFTELFMQNCGSERQVDFFRKQR